MGRRELKFRQGELAILRPRAMNPLRLAAEGAAVGAASPRRLFLEKWVNELERDPAREFAAANADPTQNRPRTSEHPESPPL